MIGTEQDARAVSWSTKRAHQADNDNRDPGKDKFVKESRRLCEKDCEVFTLMEGNKRNLVTRVKHFRLRAKLAEHRATQDTLSVNDVADA